MKITLDWLKRHLDTQASLQEIADCLNRIGLEVEGIEDRASELAPFTVGYVVKAEQHPNADRLRVCIVETQCADRHERRVCPCRDPCAGHRP
jgi:phenylalanyl-tRNA synthetase beta chain